MSSASQWQPVLEAALAVRSRAYAPYSHFAVGAAVQAKSGAIYSGCNVENASYGLTVCAERNALFQAIAAGEREFSILAVVADTPQPVAPCGACRQVMAEFGVDIIVLANLAGDVLVYRLEELLPAAFQGGNDKI
ncbi:MAG: cytidine deaminase [Anaeromusa sp.]|jgi:cytidine deaminase|uniref:cytidine deaminase n=1 Tax=Anaeromusa sp. TaxID=1872520 RepID=UPI002B1F8086|nr:cytidine deaminase [Anaeromusa sp.]MEA4835480.1 cytidine deaminase [Anaeromusa sp.]NCB75633.1 cytidine deaminase [Negativicutes bacterium]